MKKPEQFPKAVTVKLDADGEFPMALYRYEYPGKRAFTGEGNNAYAAYINAGRSDEDWKAGGFEWNKIKDLPFSWEK